MLRDTAPVRSGEQIIAERARLKPLLALTGANGFALAALCAVPMLAALAEGAHTLAAALAPGVLLGLGAGIVTTRAPPVENSRRVEALVSIALSFLLAVLFVLPGFVALGMSPIDAIFEASSAVTTTGLSVATDAQDWPFAGHLLRAWTQWIGGFAFIAAALALVVGRGVVARQLGATQGVKAVAEGASTQTRARQLLGAYAAVTTASAIGLMLLAERPGDGLLIALAAVSTGGFAPHADSLASVSPAMQAFTGLCCVAGALSLGLVWSMGRGDVAQIVRNGEARTFLGMLALVGLLVIALEWWRGGMAPGDVAFTVLSGASTAGYSTAPMTSLGNASLLLIIALMLAGGCVGSTAGGLKVSRAVFLIAMMRLALLRTRTPAKARTTLRVFGRRTEAEEGTEIAGLTMLYGLSLLALWLILLATVDAPPLAALFDAVSALSTVGLSTGVVGPDLPDFAKLSMTVAMLLGRLEFLALIALVSVSTWRRK
ncbi:MAG: potassium transporter TrkG [Pseudomonadota bacterium]